MRKWSPTTWFLCIEVLPLIYTHTPSNTHSFPYTNYRPKAHTFTSLLKPTISLAAAQQSIMRALTLEAEAPFLLLWWCLSPPCLCWTMKQQDFTSGGKSNFKRLEMSSLDLRSVWYCHVHTAIVCEVRTSQTLLLWMQIGNTIRQSHNRGWIFITKAFGYLLKLSEHL